jgi:peptidoglycan/xylan/chitin deacetylase (PgdA/CDA1 family)
MDGTAGAILMMAHFGVSPKRAKSLAASRVPPPSQSFDVDAGGIRRGLSERKQLALIFAADEFVEGAESILQTLEAEKAQASFFLTGGALAAPDMREWTRRTIAAGHYVGPHSHGHLLYAPWEERTRSLIDKQRFQADLYRNVAELRDLGGALRSPVYFLPPFEWYNADHVDWAKELGCRTISFTPGSGSHRDFAPEGHQAFRPSHELIEGILDFEADTESGLNGHLLLLHLGSARKDKMHPHIGKLIGQLRRRGYAFVRVDEMLKEFLEEGDRFPSSRP